MALTEFYTSLWKNEHSGYRDSILSPVAPEYATGEVLLGATYRKLLLGKPEANVDLEQIYELPTRLSHAEMWEEMLRKPGGLASPSLKGRRGSLPLPQLMPLVPEIARYACVLGKPRGRWDPGNLLVSVIGSGLGPECTEDFLLRLRDVLKVDEKDDILARFIEDSLRSISSQEATEARPTIPKSKASAWRPPSSQAHIPAERFSADLDYVLNLKPLLTRRQWTVLIEALLRIGLGAHGLWLCRLNNEVWHMTLDAAMAGVKPTPCDVERKCWNGHENVDPLLELGLDAVPSIKKRVQEYIQARMGLNLILHALEDAGCGWHGGIGVPAPSISKNPIEAVSAFLAHVAENSASIREALHRHLGNGSLQEVAKELADSNPSVFRTDSGGITKNFFEFIRYSLGQLQARDEEKLYDQAYILYRKTKSPKSPWPVQPGPAALILLVHACYQSLGAIPASMDDFKDYLAEYGIHAPVGELLAGETGRDMERLGLVVDSPDAGGGRLLVNPF